MELWLCNNESSERLNDILENIKIPVVTRRHCSSYYEIIN